MDPISVCNHPIRNVRNLQWVAYRLALYAPVRMTTLLWPFSVLELVVRAIFHWESDRQGFGFFHWIYTRGGPDTVPMLVYEPWHRAWKRLMGLFLSLEFCSCVPTLRPAWNEEQAHRRSILTLKYHWISLKTSSRQRGRITASGATRIHLFMQSTP